MNKLQDFVKENRFMMLIVGAVTTALGLTAIAIFIYIWSGEINVDLSRPGYEPKSQLAEDEENGNFASSGPINQAVINDFNSRVDKIRTRLGAVDSFLPDPLSDHALGIAE